MADADPRIVFVAEDARLAEAVLELLAASGIPAEIAPAGPVESSALTGESTAAAEGLPVLITDPSKLGEARELLTTAAAQAAVQAVRDRRLARTGTVAATCEECGKTSEWPAASMGTTEVCPHCSAYMDVPDPDDDWSGVDFGTDVEAKEE